MSSNEQNISKSKTDADEQVLLGLSRKVRFRIYGWVTLGLIVAAGVWTWFYLRPDRWYKYTDQVAFQQVAKDVKLGYVLWDASSKVADGLEPKSMIGEPAVSSDGARMVYTAGGSEGNANLYLRRWDGANWGPPRPMRALNSAFHEVSPAFNALQACSRQMLKLR